MTGARPTPVLPRLLVLTDRRSVPAGRTLLGTIRAAVEAGARAVVVRERDLPSAQRAALADACDRLMDVVGGVCIVADPDPRSAVGTPSDGLHMRAASRLHLRAASRLPAVRPDLLGRSAHSLAEVVRAATDGLDYVTVSPVAPSPSKPGYGPALGADGLQTLLAVAARESSRPLPHAFALGGVDQHNCGSFLAAGAYGVAVMGAVMGAERPAEVVSDLLSALLSALPSTLPSTPHSAPGTRT